MKPKSKSRQVRCSVCSSDANQSYMKTDAMMHDDSGCEFQFRKCSECDSVFLANPVAEKSIAKFYQESYLPYRGAKAWGKYARWVEKSQQKLDQERVQLLRSTVKEKEFRLLDIGCGKPTFLSLVKESGQADCHGIDFTDEGWKEQDYEELNLEKCALSAYHPKHQFEAITMWHYLEHDYHLEETAAKLYALLKQGGKLIIEVPDYLSLSAKYQKQNWQGWHSPRHLTLFSKKGFEQLFPAQKWEIERHQRFGTMDAFTLWWLGRMEAKNIDWNSSMEDRFWPLVGWKVLSYPVFLFEKLIPMGIQLIILEKK